MIKNMEESFEIKWEDINPPERVAKEAIKNYYRHFKQLNKIEQ